MDIGIGRAVGWLVRGFDRLQQRFAAYPAAVLIKFSEDQAGNLASMMTYYAFVSIFPLFLVISTVLGYVLRSHTGLEERLLHSALVDFPVIGPQLKATGLAGNPYVLVISFVVSLWGAQGVARAVQTAFNTVWSVPFTDRPNFAGSLLRSIGLLGVMAVTILATGLLSGVGSLSGSLDITLRLIAFVASVAITVGGFMLGFRLAMARLVPWHEFLRSAIASAIIWQGLLAAASLLVAHDVRHATELYGTFGVVLGLVAWLHLQSLLTLLAVEADVVRLRRLWPRSSAPPPLTRADRRAYRAYAKTTMRRPPDEVAVNVQF
ncbi:MAG TPA: YihY/virulence factor BrkB family protein, partial [Micromonosporaceae bacterium]